MPLLTLRGLTCYAQPRMRVAVLIPAYQASRTVASVVQELARKWPEREGLLVVDDGSVDDTANRAEMAGARVLRHEQNRGKGAALRTGLEAAREQGFDAVVSVDADGQHPPTEALRLRSCGGRAAIVVGVRNLTVAGAPLANRLSNAFSNFAVSGYAWHPLRDTQCGLRRYPVDRTLSLGVVDDGYAFEAEVLIRAAAARVPIVQIPVRVIYPPENERVTHFHSVRDPARIVRRVLATSALTRLGWLDARLGGR